MTDNVRARDSGVVETVKAEVEVEKGGTSANAKCRTMQIIVRNPVLYVTRKACDNYWEKRPTMSPHVALGGNSKYKEGQELVIAVYC